MDEFDSLKKLTKQLEERDDKKVTFDLLKEELLKVDKEENRVYSIGIKEDDENKLALIYTTEVDKLTDPRDKLAVSFEAQAKSILFDTELMKPITSQNGQVYMNEEAEDLLKSDDVDWSKVTASECYEGTVLLVFYHNKQWWVSTRRCLDASKSTWVRGTSYKELFEESMKSLFSYDDLDKNVCYYFILMHYKNKNIISYDGFGTMYSTLIPLRAVTKYKNDEVLDKVFDRLPKPKEFKVSSLKDVTKELGDLNYMDKRQKKVSTEGIVLKYNNNVYKFQTELYRELYEMKPNNSNRHQVFMELYQNDKLKKYASFVTSNSKSVIDRIHQTFMVLSDEMLDMYFLTLNKKNEKLYEQLPSSFKSVRYDLHGLYIKMKNKERESEEKSKYKKSLKRFHVYNYLKQLPFWKLRKVLFDRQTMIEDQTSDKYSEVIKMLNKKELSVITQVNLMRV